MNGQPNGVADTFVQGHSKDGHFDGVHEDQDADPDAGVDADTDNDADADADADDEDDEEDDEDEEEPALKYERLGGSATDLLEKDTASAVAVSLKFLVGCTWIVFTTILILRIGIWYT